MGPVAILPMVTKDLPISPRFTPQANRYGTTKIQNETQKNVDFRCDYFCIFFFVCALLWAGRVNEKQKKMRQRSVEYWPFKSIAGHFIIRVAIIATNNAISQTRPQRCRIQWTGAQSRLLRRPLPRYLHRVCFRHQVQS